MLVRTWSLLLCVVLLVGCAAAPGGHAKRMAQAAGAAPPPMVSAPGGAPAGAASLPAEKLVVTGSLALSVDDGPAAIAALRTAVESAGGRVVHEQESGHDHAWYATLRVRLPPGKVTDFLAGVDKVGRVESRLIEATDVSREYFDQELALENLRVTLDRLQALLANPSLVTANVLEIEREMTRVRGDIERIEGEHRFLQDRIAYATFEISLSATAAVGVLAAKARMYPGLRGTALYLIDAVDGADRVRFGGTATLAFTPQSSFELAIYPATDDTGRAVVVTVGGATYSDFFGAGRRRWLNPYLGGRSGYAHIGESKFVLTGTAGVEIFRSEHLTVDLGGRAHALIDGDGANAALEATAGFTVPF